MSRIQGISRLQMEFGSLEDIIVHHYHMKRLNARRMEASNKHVLLSVLCYNLKKYMRFITRKGQTTITALEKLNANMAKARLSFYWAFIEGNNPILNYRCFAAYHLFFALSSDKEYESLLTKNNKMIFFCQYDCSSVSG